MRHAGREAAAARRRLSGILAACASLAAASLAPSSVAAQSDPSTADAEERRVQGRVVRPGRGQEVPVAGAWVTLHRVGTDDSGPIDSMRTGVTGRYAFRYLAGRGSDAVFLVSAEHGGLAYFAPPLDLPDVRGDAGEILVFDTTSAELPISVHGRHLIVGLPEPDGTRELLEIIELSNDTTLTRVSGDAGRAVFAAILPADSRAHAVAGDLSPAAVEFLDGRFLLFAPLSPGLRQLTYTYRMTAGAFPMRLPLERETGVLEVLVEEEGASVSGARLEEVDPLAVEGRTFRRFLAQEVPANAVVVVSVPVPPPSIRPLWIAGTVLAVGIVLLMALSRAFQRRVVSASGTAAARPPTAAEIDRRISALDAAFASYPAPSDEARETYSSQRRRLEEERDALLARRGGGR